MFLAGACGFAAYGWIQHGAAIYLALSQNFAAWCL
ncbi:hypothetical protein J2858_001967 [Neorhizobium galegae]|nr:hypothetical protein [Neorhizobium galegae]